MDRNDQEFFDDDAPEEPRAWVPVAGADGVPEPDRTPPSRRSFLKAAALGVGATSPFWRSLVPFSAFGDDLSSLNCTANDVRIIGSGQVLNEPCNCPAGSTFTAQVRFRVVNNTGTSRYCVTLHLCPVSLPGGGTFAPPDVIIGDIPANFDGFKTVNIANYPCGAGNLCFGVFQPGDDDVDAKGVRCPNGDCCSTISWNVRPNDPCPVPAGDQISSKCRHQQICIASRGATTVDCNTGSAGVQSNCQVACGSNVTVRVCTLSPASFGPFTFSLNGQSFGPTTDTCHDFVIGPVTQNTALNASVLDGTGCAKAATGQITTTAPTANIALAGNNNCNGVLTFTASAAGFSGCTVVWKVDTQVVAGNGNQLTYQPRLDGICHTIRAELNCGGCTAVAERSVSQCATTTVC